MRHDTKIFRMFKDKQELTYEELAEYLGVGIRTVEKWGCERVQAVPGPVLRVIRLVKEFDINIKEELEKGK